MQKKPQQKSKLNRIKQRALLAIETGGSLTLFIVGVALVLLGTNHEVLAQSTPYDGLVKSFKPLDYGVCAILRFAEGGYGALLTTVAGIIAIASAAFGKYNQAYNMLIVAVGCFILRSFISLFFANYSCMNNDPTTLWHLPEANSESESGTGAGGEGSTPIEDEEPDDSPTPIEDGEPDDGPTPIEDGEPDDGPTPIEDPNDDGPPVPEGGIDPELGDPTDTSY